MSRINKAIFAHNALLGASTDEPKFYRGRFSFVSVRLRPGFMQSPPLAGQPGSHGSQSWGKRVRRLMIIFVGTVIAAFVFFALVLFFRQSSMIYLSRTYTTEQLQEVSQSQNEIITLRSTDATAAQQKIVGFYCPPHNNEALKLIWVIFVGNADTALDWVSFTNSHKIAGAGYVLIDYPSYGAHPGKPSPASILNSSEQAMNLLKEHIKQDVPIHVLGHSLGAAAALQYTVKNPVQRMILISPFTTMKAMAKRQVGWPLCELLTHRFDNVARLKEIIAAGLPATMIMHGQQDPFIPVTMGQDLAKLDSAIEFVVIPDGDHNNVISLGDAPLSTFMGMEEIGTVK